MLVHRRGLFSCAGRSGVHLGGRWIEVFRYKNVSGLVAHGFRPCRVHATTDKTAQQRDRPPGVDRALLSEFAQEPEADLLVDFDKGPSRQPPERRHGHLLADFYASLSQYDSGRIPTKTGQAQRLYAIIVEVVAAQVG